jgi:predicted transcriptional regulator
VAHIKQTWHPNAYLKYTRNVHSGLSARTKILLLLEAQPFSAAKIARESELTYNVAMYHLKLLKGEGTVERKGTNRYVWLPTGLGQKRLN